MKVERDRVKKKSDDLYLSEDSLPQHRNIAYILTKHTIGVEEYLIANYLGLPVFHEVMNTCRLSRLIAVEWWRHVIGCSPRSEWDDMDKWFRERPLEVVDGFIDGMRTVLPQTHNKGRHEVNYFMDTVG